MAKALRYQDAKNLIFWVFFHGKNNLRASLMKAVNKVLILLFQCAACLFGYAQDPAFTQYNSATLALNPALAGSSGGIRAMAGHRLQWPDLDGGYNTSVISYDQCIPGTRSGLGLMYIHDVTPGKTIVTDRIELNYAHHFSLRIKSLPFVVTPGVSVAYIAKRLDWSGLVFGSQINPQTGAISPSPYSGKQTVENIDIGAGMVMHCKYLSGGVAVQHFTEPDEGFIGTSKLPRRYVLHLAGNIGEPDSAKSFAFAPHLLYMQQQDFYMMLGGVTAKYDKFLLGLAMRTGDAFIVQAGFQMPLFRIGYSYDHTISALSNATRGSHEVMLVFNMKHKKEKKFLPIRAVAF
jgi:type IX secretion system PorP/SprF family membrane protein